MKWVTSPVPLLSIAAGLSTLAAGTWWGVWWSGLLFNRQNTTGFGFITVATAVLLGAAAALAYINHRRAAAILAVMGGTFAAGLIFVTVTYGFSQARGIEGYPLARAATILAAVLYVLTAVIGLVPAPRRLGASGELISGIVLTVVLLVVVAFVLLLIVATMND